jgi:hypothetical protein
MWEVGLLALASASGIVVTPVLYISLAYLCNSLSTRGPEAFLGIALFIVLPGAILTGGLITGRLLRNVRLSLSVWSLIALTPGVYQVLLGTMTRTIPYFGPEDYCFGLFVLSVDAMIVAVSLLGLVLGYRLFRHAEFRGHP